MRNPLLSLSLISGTVGFLIGMGHSVFQVAVEGAQAVGGIVQYPYPTPFYMYQTKVWTLLHQIPAILLRAGLSEITVSILLSGVMGMLSLLALTLAGYAISKNPWVALGAPFFIAKTGITNFGSVYGVSLWVTDTTYGVIGLSYNFLAITLISLKRYRIGGFLLGLSLAVHPAQGILYISAAAFCFLLNYSEWRDAFKMTRKFFLLGLLASAVSLALHWALTDRVTFFYPIDSKYVNAFVRHSDSHRDPVDPFSDDIWINLGTLLLSCVWLRWFRKDLPETAHFLFYSFIITAVLGFIFAGISWIPPEKLPFSLVSMMPARILDFGILGFGPLLIGLLFHEKRNTGIQFLATLFFSALVLFREPPYNLYLLLSAALLLITLKKIRLPQLSLDLCKMTAFLVFLACFFKTAEDSYVSWMKRKTRLVDWRTDSFYEAVSKGKGLLLTSPEFNMIQLITRRPVLLDMGALDSLPYTPEAGPLMHNALREIYGKDLLNPDQSYKAQETGSETSANPLWENRSVDDWKAIGRKFGLSQILAPAEYKMDLPAVTTNGEFTLYRIPEENIQS